MRGGQCVTLVGAMVLALESGVCSAQAPPVQNTFKGSDAPVRARPALRYDPATRCPDLSTATTDQAVAEVVFRVGDTGAPSQPSIKSSSGSEQLDAAATACVMRLHFFPVLRAGDGVAIDSWQEMAFGWKSPPEQQPLAHCDSSTTSAAATAKPPSTSTKLPRDGKVAVCVCVDETGKLAHAPTVLQSAGDPAFDKAAIEIATSGRYEPSTQNGKAIADCFPLSVKFQVK